MLLCTNIISNIKADSVRKQSVNEHLKVHLNFALLSERESDLTKIFIDYKVGPVEAVMDDVDKAQAFSCC